LRLIIRNKEIQEGIIMVEWREEYEGFDGKLPEKDPKKNL
jgi:hypothetical protein